MGQIEREFGVAFPGEIVDPTRWTQTAVKHLADGPIDWLAMFGRAAPVVLDLGCGNGRWLIGSAISRPECDHFGTDTLPVVVRYARKRGNQRGLANIRFSVGGGHELLERHVAPGSVAEIHCYHPQPYYLASEIGRRLITPAFVALVHRSLAPGGLFVIQTDNPGYWKYIQAVTPAFFTFHERIGRWPDAPKGRTRREIIAMRKGLRVFSGGGGSPGRSDGGRRPRKRGQAAAADVRRRPTVARRRSRGIGCESANFSIHCPGGVRGTH